MKKSFLFFLFFLMLNSIAYSATLYVNCSSNTPNYNTIQDAVDDANNNDTIEICPGTYNETVNITQNKLTLKSYTNNPDDVTIFSSSGNAVSISSNRVVITYLSLETESGRALYVTGNNNSVNNSKITADSGVGLFNYNGDIDVNDNCFYINTGYSAQDSKSGNDWDSNYWQENTSCTDSNNDGICDTPYSPNTNITDNYPLVTCSATSTPVPKADWHFDECFYDGTSGEVKDSTANNYTGTAYNSTTVNGQICKAIDFTTDDTSDYISLDHNAANGLTDFTITTWIKTSKTEWQPLISGAGSSSFNELLFWLSNSHTFTPFIKSSNGNGIAIQDIADDTWHFMAWTRNGDENCVYVDGVKQGCDTGLPTGPLDIADGGLIIGQEQDSVGGSFDSTQNFVGLQDELKIFDQSLTDNQIKDIYDNEKNGKNFDGTTRDCPCPIPVVDYRLDECSYDGTTGEVEDSSPNNLNGTAENGANTSNGKICLSGIFDGNDDYIEIDDNPLLDITDNLTVMFWINPTTIPSSDLKTILSKDNNYEIHINSQGKIYWWWGGGQKQLTSNSTISLNQWTHVTITYKSGEQKIYINGTEDINNNSTGSLNTNNLPLQIGQDQGVSSRYFDGKIDEVKVYNKTLDSVQIQNIYNNESNNKNYDGSERTCKCATLKAEWRFDECSWNGTTNEVEDSGLYDYNGTATNTTTIEGYLCKAADLTKDDTSDYISLDHNAANGLTDFTFTTWIKTSKTGSQPLISGAGNSSSYGNEMLFWLPDSHTFRPYIKGYNGYNISIQDIADDTWHFMVWTRNGDENCVYVDGVKQGCDTGLLTGALDIADGGLIIGQEQDSVGGGFTSSQNFVGLQDEVKIFDGVLDDQRIQDIYNNELNGKNWDGTDRSCKCLIPVAEYRLDECSWDGTSGEVEESIAGQNITSQNGAQTNDDAVICRSGAFDGSDDKLQGTFNHSFDNEVTLSAWIKTTGGSDSKARVVEFSNSDGEWEYGTALAYDSTSKIIKGWTVNSSGYPSGRTEIVKYDLESNGYHDGNWHHLLYTYNGTTAKLYVDGDLKDSKNTNIGDIQDASTVVIGGYYRNNNNSFNGQIDEVKIYDKAFADFNVKILYDNEKIGKNYDGSIRNCLNCNLLDHYLIEHDGVGLTCQPEDISIKACANSDCSQLYSSSADVTLHYDGADKSSYTFTGSTSANVIHQDPGTVTVSLTNMNPTATNGFECLNTATNSNSCDIIFYDAGFIFDIPNDYSCKEQTDVLIKAVRKDDQTQRCVPGFQDKTIPVDFSFSYINPNTNSVGTLPKINNTDLNATIDLDFDSNGESHFDYLYNDAGQILITASYDNATHKAVGNDNVTSKPYGFYVYSTTPNSDANNGSNSSVFVKAGEDFNLTTSAVCWQSDNDTDLSDNTITPNYIESNIPVTHDLIEPAGGNTGSIKISSLNFTNGTSSIDNQTFSEVGIITFTVKDDDYLGTGDISGTSQNIGRFTPHHFKVTKTNDGIFNNSCSNFTYSGQSFTYLTTPKISIEAQNIDNQTTLNYRDSYNKLTASSIHWNTPNTDNTTIGANGTLLDLAANILTGILTPQNNGFTDYDFSSNDTYTYTKNDNAKVNPFDSDIKIPITQVIDSDNIEDNGDLPIINPDSNHIKYGRLHIFNNYGPETEDLIIKIYTEYLKDSIWQTNSDDNCTTLDVNDFNLTNFTDNLDSADTSILNVSGIDAGSGYLTLEAPGKNNTGSVDIELQTSAPYYNWLSPEEKGTGTFGIYRGRDSIISWDEINPSN